METVTRYSFLSLDRSRYYLILFIFWPFLAFMTALADYSRKEARWVVYLFLIYYGFSFVNNDMGVDAYRYAMKLEANAALPFSAFFSIVGGIYATDTSVDIIEPLISFIVSRFTTEDNILFAVWAAIFGYFYLKTLNRIYSHYEKNRSINAFILMLFFGLILPITSISGIRMWTAAWIFIFGAYHVILYRDPKYLLVALSASLVHFSFLTANVILIIWFFAGNRNLIYLPVTLVSFILPSLMGPFFKSLSLRVGGGLQSRYEGYASEGYIMKVNESFQDASWFMGLSKDLIFWFLILAIIIIQIKTRRSNRSQSEKNLFSFLLLFLAFVNFGKAIPSFGERFQVLFFLLAALYIFLYFANYSGRKISLLVLAGLFPMLLNILVTFRIGSVSISAWIFAPGLGLPSFVPVLSVAQLLFP